MGIFDQGYEQLIIDAACHSMSAICVKVRLAYRLKSS